MRQTERGGERERVASFYVLQEENSSLSTFLLSPLVCVKRTYRSLHAMLSANLHHLLHSSFPAPAPPHSCVLVKEKREKRKRGAP